MRVNPNSELGPVTRTASPTGTGDPRLGADRLSLTTAAGLNRALEQTPAVRAEKVAQARSLIEDAPYPPPELIRKIAALLAMHSEAIKGESQAPSD